MFLNTSEITGPLGSRPWWSGSFRWSFLLQHQKGHHNFNKKKTVKSFKNWLFFKGLKIKMIMWSSNIVITRFFSVKMATVVKYKIDVKIMMF